MMGALEPDRPPVTRLEHAMHEALEHQALAHERSPHDVRLRAIDEILSAAESLRAIAYAHSLPDPLDELSTITDMARLLHRLEEER